MQKRNNLNLEHYINVYDARKIIGLDVDEEYCRLVKECISAKYCYAIEDVSGNEYHTTQNVGAYQPEEINGSNFEMKMLELKVYSFNKNKELRKALR